MKFRYDPSLSYLFGTLIILLAGSVSWSETITLYATSMTQGRMEQCGCATNIEGGLEARAGFLEQARQENPDSILVDLGGFMPPKKEKKKSVFLLPNENDIQTAVGEIQLRAMERLHYDVVLPSPNDLSYGAKVLYASPPFDFYLVSHLNPSPDWIAPYRIVSRNGLKIGMVGAVSLLDKTMKVGNDFTITPFSQSVIQTIELVRNCEKADLVLLLAHEPPPTIRRWITENQGLKIDGVITLDFGIKVEKVGDTFLVNAPGKGRAIGKITIEWDRVNNTKSISSLRIPLDPQKYKNQAMREFLTASYQQMLKELRPEHPRTNGMQELPADNGYTGAEVCMSCHIEEYEQWKKTRHASAFYDLLEQTRHWVPACIQCHVTAFGQREGFQSFPQTSAMMHVQCETCHGPGRKHVDEMGTGAIQRIPDKNLCLQCHSPEFSPKFESMYDLYYKQVTHQ